MRLSDDELMDWIEAFENGASVPQIAAKSGWPEATVYAILVEQGVAEYMPPDEREVRPIIPEMREVERRAARGELTEKERRIAGALGHLGPVKDTGGKYARGKTRLP